ncbi:sterol desaturase family protein [Shewanella olleyana]|uniref:sterol desaturase family protein n=1 Tax=Shewanella olleyana TaxID=135626 RepID=UPI002010600D|nr:sterol desaturase family protein [Shewanella olleyana]MCL1067070.1 sterol desaturase family protein [Shewanella olleyana]
MPTPLEILIDPISIILLLILCSLALVEFLSPARPLPKVKGWLAKSLLCFIFYFYLSSYLPLIWDQYLLPFQLFDLQHMNPYISTIIAIFVFELLIYIWHRTMHKVNFLWRSFHQMHHSAERLDSIGAFYLSPLDMIGFTFVGSLTLALVIGLSPQAISWFLYITMFLVVFQHTNINTPQWVGYFIQRPESHSVHHEKGVHAYNYSDLPIFDIMFGTFKNPVGFVDECGFYAGGSDRVVDALLFKDIAKQKTVSYGS